MAWYDPDWLYRKPLTLTGGPSGGQSNFQIDLAVAHVTDHMQTDFDDLRFTQNDGTTLIDAWLESKVDDTSAAVWAEFPSTPANTVEQNYYMYYGNGLAASYWDGVATFPDFFEDFESVADWDYSSSYNISSYSFTAIDGIGDMMVSAANNNHIVRYKKDCTFNTTNKHFRMRFKGDANTEIFIDDTGSNRWRAAWLSSPSSYTIYDEAWETNGDITNIRTHTRGVAAGTQHNYFDFMLFRKYASGPPTYAFGSEESAPTGGRKSAFYGPFIGPFGGPIQ